MTMNAPRSSAILTSVTELHDANEIASARGCRRFNSLNRWAAKRGHVAKREKAAGTLEINFAFRDMTPFGWPKRRTRIAARGTPCAAPSAN